MPSSTSLGRNPNKSKAPSRVLELLKKPGSYATYMGFKSKSKPKNQQSQKAQSPQHQTEQSFTPSSSEGSPLSIDAVDQQLQQQQLSQQEAFNTNLKAQQDAVAKAQADNQATTDYHNQQRKGLLDEYFKRNTDYQGVLSKLYQKQDDYDKQLMNLQLELNNARTQEVSTQSTNEGQAVQSSKNKSKMYSLLRSAYRPQNLTRSY